MRRIVQLVLYIRVRCVGQQLTVVPVRETVRTGSGVLALGQVHRQAGAFVRDDGGGLARCGTAEDVSSRGWVDGGLRRTWRLGGDL